MEAADNPSLAGFHQDTKERLQMMQPKLVKDVPQNLKNNKYKNICQIYNNNFLCVMLMKSDLWLINKYMPGLLF